jgi:hypothetical protein
MSELNPFLITDLPGFSSQIGRLICMMNYARHTTLQTVAGLSPQALDHLHDANSNSIGALLLHAAAVEFAYQRRTFDGRDLNDPENAKWGAALDLGERGRAEIRGHPLSWYMDSLAEVRRETLKGFVARNDEWLATEELFHDGLTANYHFMWFHVLEDEINHRGQMRYLRKRLPF